MKNSVSKYGFAFNFTAPITVFKTITLKDGTPQQWLANDKAVFKLYDEYSGISYSMVKSGNVWVAEVPETVSSVVIKRLNPSNGAVWNSWTTEINGSTFTATSNKSGNWS